MLLVIAALLVLAGGIWGLRRTPRLWRAAAQTSADALVDARSRLRAGEPVVLWPSQRKWTKLLLLSLVLAVGSVLAFAATPGVIVGLCAVLFGAWTLIATLRLIPGRACLRIAPERLVIAVR